MISFTRAVAQELARFGIQVNAIAPGLIKTEMLQDMDEEMIKKFTDKIPLGRIGTANDVANAVLFLASQSADYITGQTISVDGGLGI